MVELLSEHLYSSPRVYLRELVQNGVDAVTARRLLPVLDDAAWDDAVVTLYRLLDSTGREQEADELWERHHPQD